MKKIEQLEKHLEKIMSRTKELAHGQETKAWLLKMDPEVPWQLQIAALAHDIERAVPYIEGMTPPEPPKEDLDYDSYKNLHAKRSAEIVSHILKTFDFETADITRISNAIEKHEVGGDPDSDLVRDADSIRWFDSGYTRYTKSFGMEAAKEKGWWMYKRATNKTKKLMDTLPYDNEIKKHIQSKKA